MSRLCAALVLALLSAGPPATLRGQKPDLPEEAIRQLVRAIYANDAAAYERVSLPHPRWRSLVAGGRKNLEKLRALDDNPDGLQVREARPLLFDGRIVEEGDVARVRPGTTGLYVVAHGGSPTVVRVVRRPEGWRVDLRWWVAAIEQEQARPAEAGSPSIQIRSLLAAMLQLDRSRAASFLTNPADLTTLFQFAPRQREPSGVLDAMVGEMPLVEVGADDWFLSPSGEPVQGGGSGDRAVWVGQCGPVEMPFVLRRIGSAWRIVAEPYFAMLMS